MPSSDRGRGSWSEDDPVMENLYEYLTENISAPLLRVGLIFGAALLAAFFVRLVVIPILLHLTKKTRTELDDQIIHTLGQAVIVTLILLGIGWSLVSLNLSAQLHSTSIAILKTVVILIWSRAFLRVGNFFLEIMSCNRDKLNWIQPQTLPLLQIFWKVIVVGALAYFLMIAWRINPTSWLASAGVAGIAIGFAAKDTLANLFAGIFILADTPFKIGDYVILENGLRGKIIDIGIRSSRMLTRDDVEVTVPNAVIANAQLVNETGGPYQKMRIRVKVDVAYGSDVDQVREVLLACTDGVNHIAADPAPRVRFREFGGSGLRFELLAWVREPVYRGRILDQLNEKVYKAFHEAGIEIPYTKQDVYVKEWPGRSD
jgi:small-conductance mechanosensitive channel